MPGGDTLEDVFTVDDTVQCRVTPSDGETDGTTVTSAAVSVANAAPEIVSVEWTPNPPLTDDTLSVSLTTTDLEGDDVTLSYAWTVNGLSVGDDSHRLEGAAYFSKDDSIGLTIVPSDGASAGTAYTRSGVIVGNTPPGPPTPVVTPEEPAAGEDDLICEVEVASADADDDAVTYAVTWQLEGVDHTGDVLTTEYDGDTVPAEDTEIGEIWTCTMTPNDGVDEGTPGEASITVQGQSYSEDFSGCPDSDCGGLWPSTSSDGYIVAGEQLYSRYDDGATTIQHDLSIDLGGPISADQWVFQFRAKHTLASGGSCSAHQAFVLRSEDFRDYVGVGFQDYRAFQQYWYFPVQDNHEERGTPIHSWMTEVPPSDWTEVTIQRDGNTITFNGDDRTRTATVSDDFGLDLQILDFYTTYSSNCDPPTVVRIDDIVIRQGTTEL